MGTRNSQAAGVCVEPSSPDPRRGDGSPAPGAADAIRATSQGAALLTQEAAAVEEAAVTLPVTLRFTGAQLALLSRCMEYEGKTTAAEWLTEKSREIVALLLGGCFGVSEEQAYALWDGKEVA